MRCRTCQYALWNLRTRECPECGERFAPSDYEFRTNAVSFVCPHCDQDYYGTSEKGHLVPRVFACVSCGNEIDMDHMVVRPAPGIAEANTMLERVPWEERAEQSVFKRYWKTASMGLISPHRLTRSLPDASGTGPSWSFALLTHSIVTVAILVPVLLFNLIMTGVMGGGMGIFFTVGILAIGGSQMLYYIVGTVVWGLVAHAVLRLTGPLEHTIGRTFQAINYGAAGNLASGVPCIGWYFGWIWWIISATAALHAGHKIALWRSILAGGLVPGLSILVLFGAWIWLIFGLSTMAQMGGPGQQTYRADAAERTSIVLNAVNDHHQRHDALPRHGFHLFSEGLLDSADIVCRETHSRHFNIRINDIHIAVLHYQPVDRQRSIADLAADTLPENVLAHRVGDFVFTYHGISLPAPDGNLWLVICSPDPDQNTADDIDGVLHVGLADGTTLKIALDEFREALEAQNRLRAGHGLHHLPPPWLITHGDPAKLTE